MVIDRYHFIIDNEVIESDVVIATATEWAASQESQQRGWSVVRTTVSGPTG
jgi:hypothetical protein